MTEEPRTDRPRPLAPLAPLAIALLMGTALPAQAQLKGLTGSGLYDFLVQTNCVALSEQQDTRTPDWITDGTYPNNRVPLLAAGMAQGIVRTVDLPDQVKFFSSNPAVIEAPAKIQAVGAIGGVPYQPTDVFFTVNASSRPRDVDITAVSSTTTVIGAVARLGQPTRVTRKFRVYPPQRISKAATVPARKRTYEDGEQVRIEVILPWRIPISTATVVIGRPVYQNAQGEEVRAYAAEWREGNAYHREKRIAVPPNTNKVTFEFTAEFPSDAKVKRVTPIDLNTSFVVPIQLTSEHHARCPGLITDPMAAEVSYSVHKRLNVSLQAKPALPRPVQQVPLARPGSSEDGVPAPRDPLPSKPDPEPEDHPQPKPGIRQ